MRISATVITFNEEKHLDRCLKSVRGLADELIVVDAGSRDGTCAVAARWGARVYKRDWTNYSDQKNFAAAQASHEWILSLDADECLSPPLRERLLEVKAHPAPANAYEFPRRAFYLGRWIRHCGWYPDRKPRLYRRSQGHWVGDFVHEHLVCEGPIGRLEGDLLHYTCDSVSDHARRVGRYTSLAARDLQARGIRSGPLKILGSPVVAFLGSYCFKAGFMDGMQGFLISAFAAYYNFLKYSKLWDLQRSQPPGRVAGEDPRTTGAASRESYRD